MLRVLAFKSRPKGNVDLNHFVAGLKIVGNDFPRKDEKIQGGFFLSCFLEFLYNR